MCVIVIARGGVILPKLKIRRMYETNPDGFGIIEKREKSFFLKKGLIKDIDEMDHLCNENYKNLRIIHFRLATHGMVTDTLCHPFIIPKDSAEIGRVMNVTEGEFGLEKYSVIFHNGVFGKGVGMIRMMDNPLAELIYSDSLVLAVGLAKGIFSEGDIPNKCVLLDSSGIVRMYGRFEEDGNLIVSNRNYERRSIWEYEYDWKKMLEKYYKKIEKENENRNKKSKQKGGKNDKNTRDQDWF